MEDKKEKKKGKTIESGAGRKEHTGQGIMEEVQRFFPERSLKEKKWKGKDKTKDE